MPERPLPREPDFTRLSFRMSQRRRELGMTFEELAEATGLSRRSIFAIEAGERSGNVRSWFLIAQALQLSMSDLMAELDR